MNKPKEITIEVKINPDGNLFIPQTKETFYSETYIKGCEEKIRETVYTQLQTVYSKDNKAYGLFIEQMEGCFIVEAIVTQLLKGE